METSPPRQQVPSGWREVARDASGNPIYSTGSGETILVERDSGVAHVLDVDSKGNVVGVKSQRPLSQYQPQSSAAMPQPPAPRPAQSQERLRGDDGRFVSRLQGGKRMRRPRLISGEYWGNPSFNREHGMRRSTTAVIGAVAVTVIAGFANQAIDVDPEKQAQGVGRVAEGGGSIVGAAAGAAISGGREIFTGTADGAGLDFQSPVEFEDSAEDLITPTTIVGQNTSTGGVVIGGTETPVVVETTLAPQSSNGMSGLPYQPGFGGEVTVTNFDSNNPTSGFGTPTLIAKECGRLAGLSLDGDQAKFLYNSVLVPNNAVLADGPHGGEKVVC